LIYFAKHNFLPFLNFFWKKNLIIRCFHDSNFFLFIVLLIAWFRISGQIFFHARMFVVKIAIRNGVLCLIYHIWTEISWPLPTAHLSGHIINQKSLNIFCVSSNVRIFYRQIVIVGIFPIFDLIIGQYRLVFNALENLMW
jgi:hypothetical protein